MMAILPFEKDFYKKYNINIDFVGHPLLDEVAKFKSAGIPELLEKEDKRPIIALLPGSRKQEISKMLPEMIEAANYFPDYKFVIAGAPSQKASFYHEFMQESKIELIFGKTYDLLHSSHAALVTSGTATLETALFNVPQVVCYRTSGFSYQIGKRLINVPFISLVNLILNKEVVSELVQDECNASRMQTELKLILDGVKREEMLDAYQVLKTKLGGTGASLNAAKIVLETANS
jgi:lipid-A-disaccharide synthase